MTDEKRTALEKERLPNRKPSPGNTRKQIVEFAEAAAQMISRSGGTTQFFQHMSDLTDVGPAPRIVTMAAGIVPFGRYLCAEKSTDATILYLRWPGSNTAEEAEPRGKSASGDATTAMISLIATLRILAYNVMELTWRDERPHGHELSLAGPWLKEYVAGYSRTPGSLITQVQYCWLPGIPVMKQ